jgi:cation diffusion facilitator CzcD-associated flavoprotein CzcO
VADKYGLRRYIKLSHQVEHAEWDESSGKWSIKITNLTDGTVFEDQCDILINATGIFKYVFLSQILF